MNRGVSVIGVGHRLPLEFEDNALLCRNLSVTPEWIVEKTGITRRYLASPSDSASAYASEATLRAIEMAGIDPTEIDLIIACTFSADYVFPALSSRLQQQFGSRHCQTFDLQANCAGFVTGLTVAADRMKNDHSLRYAVVVAVEFNSRYVDRSDVNTAIYLSDGAGAVVLGPNSSDEGILASAFMTDATGFEAVRMRGGGSSYRSTDDGIDPAARFMEMNGLATWKQAITHLPPTIRRACEKARIELAQVDHLLFHQANYRLIEYIVKKMGFDLSKTFTNVERIGNTGAASVAIALSEAVNSDRIRDREIVVMAAVGAGFVFGASVWRWKVPSSRKSQVLRLHSQPEERARPSN